MEFIKNDLFSIKKPVEDSAYIEYINSLTNLPFDFNGKLRTDFYTSDDNELVILKTRVLYGYRLQAGYIDEIEDTHELDICCGPNKVDYDLMFNKIKTIIEYNVNQGLNPFAHIPHWSKIKPYFNDKEFCNIIQNLYEKATYETAI